MRVIKLKRQTWRGYIADMLMVPIMYLLQGTIRECPQRTHRWNNQKLSSAECKALEARHLLSFRGEASASKRWLGFIPHFHMPILGGWRTFVVLAPVNYRQPWHVGWLPDDVRGGVSQVGVIGPVRVTLGPGPVKFFGLTEDGRQIELTYLGRGQIGTAPNVFRNLPLL